MGTRVTEDSSGSRNQVELGFSWEIFVLLLSILSIANLVFVLLPISDASKQVILVVDGVLTLVFLADFARRMQVAPSKRGYFLHGGGYLDLLGSIPVPGLRLARLFRIVRAVRMVRRYGLAGMAKRFGEGKAEGSILIVIFIAILVLELSSIFVLHAEHGAPDANITNASDALWWSYVTITTVGYGDRFPVTNEGRVVGVLLMTIGVGIFSTFAGFLANTFLAPRKRREAVREAVLSAAPPKVVPAADLEAIRELVEEQERVTEELRSRLAELDR
jgi:voltage-gated potassium channel